MNRLVCTSLLALLASACRPEAVPTSIRLDARLARHLSVAAGTGQVGIPVWRRDGLTMSADSQEGVAALRQLNETLHMVMVSVPADSTLAGELADDARVLAFLPSPDGRSVHAVLPGGDPVLLGGLASAAHAAAGHACGNLEGLNFRALTDADDVTPPLYLESVKLTAADALAGAVDDANIGQTIGVLEDMGTRYHDSSSGLEAPAKIQELFETAGAGIAGLSVKLVDHERSSQRSVVVTIPGTEDPGTVIAVGAHLDSINRDGPTSPAPGADDDASGIATLVETLRAIAATGSSFRRTVELHAYAAEEVGLYGSQELAASYRDAGRNVAAIMQIDMNSYSADGSETIYLITNDTSATLRRSLKDLLNTYLGGGFVEESLSAGTSDHRSWSREGFQAVFPFEHPTNYNHALHSTSDTSETLNNLALSGRFGKLALLFLSHHAGLAAAAADYEGALAAQKAAHSDDLALAFVAGAVDGTDVAVAAPTGVQRVEMCEVATAGSALCVGPRVAANAGRTSADRGFFLSAESMTLAAGDRLAVFGYDGSDVLTAQRTVRLEAP